MARLEVKRRLRSLVMFLPNLVVLCVRLVSDSRVPKTEKILLTGAVVYALMPLDLIPDFLPFVGQIDDIYLISLTLIRLVNRTDAEIVREHWRGSGDVVALIDAIAAAAPMLLPKRVRRVLESKVDVEPQSVGQTIEAVLTQKPILVETIIELEEAK